MNRIQSKTNVRTQNCSYLQCINGSKHVQTCINRDALARAASFFLVLRRGRAALDNLLTGGEDLLGVTSVSAGSTSVSDHQNIVQLNEYIAQWQQYRAKEYIA